MTTIEMYIRKTIDCELINENTTNALPKMEFKSRINESFARS